MDARPGLNLFILTAERPGRLCHGEPSRTPPRSAHAPRPGGCRAHEVTLTQLCVSGGRASRDRSDGATVNTPLHQAGAAPPVTADR